MNPVRNLHFKSFSLYIPGIVALVLLLAGFLIVHAFTSPTQAPPGGNVPAPVNVGPSSQTKTGGLLSVFNLWVNSALGVTGGATFGGNVGIGTASPGARLEVAGQVKITGGVPGSGKVLISDANGLASWATPSSGVVKETDPTVPESVKDGVSWGELSAFPSACTPPQFVSGVGATGLSCGNPPLGVGGFGTANFVPRWTAPATLSISEIFDEGTRVGIGTTSPTSKLDVAGAITATKLTVGTIDPVYEIDGKKYATYVADVAGGVKTEVTGTFTLANGSKIIDFNNQDVGSDLWLFWQTSNKNVGDIAVLLTPSFDGKAWYEKKPTKNQIIISASQNGEVSFRLTAPRKDAAQWPNEIKE